MERYIIENEERCYRFRHHNFEGLTVKETAKRMKISIRKVRLLLKSLKAKAPQLFPILTPRQYFVYWLYMETGMPQHRIAEYLRTTQSNIWGILNRIKKKGISISHSGLGDMVSYEKNMDEYISHKF